MTAFVQSCPRGRHDQHLLPFVLGPRLFLFWNDDNEQDCLLPLTDKFLRNETDIVIIKKWRDSIIPILSRGLFIIRLFPCHLLQVSLSRHSLLSQFYFSIRFSLPIDWKAKKINYLSSICICKVDDTRTWPLKSAYLPFNSPNLRFSGQPFG